MPGASPLNIAAQADPAAVRADEQALRQWAVNHALIYVGGAAPERAIEFAAKLVEFVKGGEVAR